jgi:hypothetical protein
MQKTKGRAPMAEKVIHERLQISIAALVSGLPCGITKKKRSPIESAIPAGTRKAHKLATPAAS